jgi:hypothetical protein
VQGSVDLVIGEDIGEGLPYILLVKLQLGRGSAGLLDVDADNALHFVFLLQPVEQPTTEVSPDAGDSDIFHASPLLIGLP